MVDRCHYTFVQTHRIYNPGANPSVNNGLWVIMMCECSFINYNKHKLVEDVDILVGEAIYV